jgi:hypothetical protein
MIIGTFLFYDDLFNKDDLNSDITDKNTKDTAKTTEIPETSIDDEVSGNESLFTIKVYEDYDDIILKFKKSYIECVNEDKDTIYEFLFEGSEYEKYLTKKIDDLNKQSIKLELKELNLTDVEENGEFLFFYVEEEIGIKEFDKDYEYSISKIKYKVESTELGYIFEGDEIIK